MTAKTKKVRRPKQSFIPGGEPLCVPDLDAAMEVAHHDKLEAKEAIETAKASNAAVGELMLAAGLTEYKAESVGLTATRKPASERVSIKKIKVKVSVSPNGEPE